MTTKAIVNESHCTGCEACLGLCPTEAIVIKGGIAKVTAIFCKGCGLCAEGCGEDAIRVIEYAPI
jgi:Pyruvate/2-oxoacid:ferredoxin oxidoreductase delta subunit